LWPALALQKADQDKTMPNFMKADNAAEAVRKFAEPLAAAPDRVLAKLDGPGGMASLCAVEAALAGVWPMSTAKELVWLPRAPGTVRDTLRLSAYAADGEVLGEARFELAA
jgi:hypothetical protein